MAFRIKEINEPQNKLNATTILTNTDMHMSIFSTVWVDGKINDIDTFLLKNSDTKFMFVLDTNFAIMAREYISNRDTFNKNYASQKADFLHAVDVIKQHATRIIYAFACEEASRSKATGNIDSEKYKLMVNCISEIFNLEFRTDILSKNELITEDIRFTKTPLLLKNGVFKEQSVILYVTLLKAYLMKHFDLRDPKTKIKDTFHYMADEINAFSPTSTSLVIHYLGHEPSILKGIKPSLGLEKILDKLYAATIDLLLPTKVAQVAELSYYQEIPIFVTFDKGIKLLFDSLLIMDLHRFNNGEVIPSYSTMIFYSSGWKDKDIVELCKYAEQVQRKPRRKVIDKKYEVLRLKELAGELEQELIKKLEQRFNNT